MIQVLRGSPTKSHIFKLFAKHKPTRGAGSTPSQALLIGTPKSGKKTVLQHIDTLELPLDVICLSSDVPVATYHNFLFDVPFVIFVFDSTQFSLQYLERVAEILRLMLGTGSCCRKLLVLVNKHDLLGLEQFRVLEKRLNLYQLDVEFLIMPTNGVTGYGISEGVNWLLM